MFNQQRYCCHTNIDDGRRETWPTDFVTCPKIGDYVEAESGYQLVVCTIYHRMVYHQYGSRIEKPYPQIIVELTKKCFGYETEPK
jgi:hypothetical protein